MTIEWIELRGGPHDGVLVEILALPFLVDELAMRTPDVPARYRRTGECGQLRGLGQVPYSRRWIYVWTPEPDADPLL